jgi:hypothetical protein
MACDGVFEVDLDIVGQRIESDHRAFFRNVEHAVVMARRCDLNLAPEQGLQKEKEDFARADPATLDHNLDRLPASWDGRREAGRYRNAGALLKIDEKSVDAEALLPRSHQKRDVMIGGVRHEENARDLLSARDMSVDPFKDIFEVGLGLRDDPA